MVEEDRGEGEGERVKGGDGCVIGFGGMDAPAYCPVAAVAQRYTRPTCMIEFILGRNSNTNSKVQMAR
jgi:hypothetical protein